MLPSTSRHFKTRMQKESRKDLRLVNRKFFGEFGRANYWYQKAYATRRLVSTTRKEVIQMIQTVETVIAGGAG
jgi:hypothetical protein